MVNEFNNKTYLITGASRGIGKAVCKKLADCGANLILVARSDKVYDVVNEILDKYNKHRAIQYDLTNLSKINEIYNVCRDNNIKLDGMVHCAGMAPLMKISENNTQQMLDTFSVNYFSFVELLKYFQSDKISENGSSIVAMSSVVSLLGNYRQSIYGSSKAALDLFIKSAAIELLPRHIRINTIVAGCVDTEMFDHLKLNSDNLEEKLKIFYPLGVIPAENIADIVCFLLSEKAKYITGVSMPVDSGRLLKV